MSDYFASVTILLPTEFTFPGAAVPAQTAEGRAVWDTDDDVLTIGTGAARRTLVNVAGAQTLTDKTLTSPVITTTPTAAGSTWADLGAVTTIDINGGTVDGVTIGASVAPSQVKVQDNALQIENPAATFIYTIVGGAILADRQLNLPVLAATDTVAVLSLAQTLENKTLTGTVSITGQAAATSLLIAGHVTGGAAAQRDIVFQTGNAINPQALATRLTIGSNAAEAVITWANSNHVGLKLGGALAANTQDITSINALTFAGTPGYIYRTTTTSYIQIRAGTAAAGTGAIITMEGSGAGNNLYLQTAGAGATDVVRVTFAGGAATTTITWAASYHVGLKFGLAGTATGAFTMDGATSGVVTVTVAATAGTWTLTLPPDDGDAGEQLQTNGAGVTTWEAAASSRAVKNILGVLDPKVALARFISAVPYQYRYKPEAPHVGGDYATLFTGVLAEEAPWAMKDAGAHFNPINAFGHTVAAFQALYQELTELRQQVAALQS